MSYQPYPTAGNQGGYQAAQRPPQPTSVRTAVWLIYAGAAISAISAVFVLALQRSIKNAVGTALVKTNATLVSQGKKPLTISQIHSVESAFVGVALVILIIAIALWVWMAWANGGGKSWARIVASVLFGFNTLWLFLAVTRGGTSALLIGLGWLAGLGAIIMLWRSESAAYFKAGL
jgi:hypothetical protein